MCGYNPKGCTEGMKEPSLFIKHEYILCMYVCMYVWICTSSGTREARERERRDAHEEHGGDDERPRPSGRVQPDDRRH